MQNETWVVNLWIANDEGLYHGALALDLEDYDWRAARTVRDFIEEAIDLSGGIVGDLVARALDRVDWADVASTIRELQGND